MFRILDLGAHDGFVGTWLASQLPGLHIDGVEANSTGVERANARARQHGISGEYVQGLAEDASTFFEPGSYDAVVSYEVLEHVPNVDRFLDECEAMCRTGGRVYLSTPNGCFGEGHNPHHLRVYRAIDLFELCRRRGTVKDMVAGHDGVSVIAYEPAPDLSKPELAIYCGPGWEKWHPMDIATKGLGGSETAAVRLAEAMSEQYTVTVYGEVDFGAWRQVCFKPHQTFDPTQRRDALIVSRQPWLLDAPINAGRTLLWMHDTDYQDQMTPARIDKVDAVMVLSNWHAEHVMKCYEWLDESKLVVTGNAIEPRYFTGTTLNFDCPNVALYSSSPDRGLDLLLKLWPKVREQVPDAELHYCYSSVYDKVAQQNPVIGKFRAEIEALADQPGVVNLGSLSQPDLVKKMEQCKTWLAPSYHTPQHVKFYETYCIGALEAAAAGCTLVVGNWGALAERVEDAINSITIPEPPVDAKYEAEWVSAIVNSMVMCTPQKSPMALETTWAMRAIEFDQVIRDGVSTTA